MPFSEDYSGSGNFDDQNLVDSRSIYVPAIGTIALLTSAIAAVYFVKKKCNIENAEDNRSKPPKGYNYGLPIDRKDMIVDIADKSKLSFSSPRALPTIREEGEFLDKQSNDKRHISGQRDTVIYI